MLKSVFTMLNNLINRAVGAYIKVLKSLIKALFVIIIRQYLGLHDVDVLCKERHERFFRRIGLLSLRHAVLQSLTAQYSYS